MRMLLPLISICHGRNTFNHAVPATLKSSRRSGLPRRRCQEDGVSSSPFHDEAPWRIPAQGRPSMGTPAYASCKRSHRKPWPSKRSRWTEKYSDYAHCVWEIPLPGEAEKKKKNKKNCAIAALRSAPWPIRVVLFPPTHRLTFHQRCRGGKLVVQHEALEGACSKCMSSAANLPCAPGH